MHYILKCRLFLHFLSFISIDNPMFGVKYLVIHKVEMHAGVISKLVYGFASVWAIIYSLKLVGYLLVQTHKPYNNLWLLRAI